MHAGTNVHENLSAHLDIIVFLFLKIKCSNLYIKYGNSQIKKYGFLKGIVF